MKDVVPLAKATDTSVFGSKAVGLGDAERNGLHVPPGVALSGPVVEAVGLGRRAGHGPGGQSGPGPGVPLAVRSSAVDEDGAEASFAGQHLTLLNVPTAADVPSALRDIWWSANSDSAITYRQRVGLFTRPSVGVVIQTLLDPDVAGVLFTENPVTGADERVIEASWGLGEAVVAGLVIPDHYRFDRSGQVLERKPGRKSIAVRTVATGGTVEEDIAARPGRGPLPRRRSAPAAEPAGRPVRAGLRPRTGHRMGLRRWDPLPAAMPGRHHREVGGTGHRRGCEGGQPGRDAPSGSALRRARPERGGQSSSDC